MSGNKTVIIIEVMLRWFVHESSETEKLKNDKTINEERHCGKRGLG